MNEVLHRTGTVQSGDVALFYRHFGQKTDKAPLIILHGSNYFDSYDWIGVGTALGADREVVAFDYRGFGRSGWSKNKDYSLDANFSDIQAISAHFGWKKPVIVGHSVSGRLSIFFAACCPDSLSQLIVVDTEMGSANPGAYKVSLGNEAKIFKTVEEAMASLAGKENPPRFSQDRARAQQALKPVEGGFVLTRDPDHKNTQSQAPGAPRPRFTDVNAWEALGQIKCPVTFIRGARSDRNKPETYGRIAREFPNIRVETIDSRHDVAFEAPDELVTTIRRILDRPA